MPRLLRVVDRARIRALVRAGNRPEQESELAALAKSAGLPLLVQPLRDSVEYAQFVDRVRSLAPELILVDLYSMLLPPEVLAIPRLGGVNVHYAPLPRYRGPNPIQWALINNEHQAGVTLHCMTGDFDAGDILAQALVPIRFDDTWMDVTARIDRVAEPLIAEQVPRLLDGTAVRRPQADAEASRFPRRTEEDGRIDWSHGVLEIYNLIRALVAPLPGAFHQTPRGSVVIDRFLTISEVAAFKFGEIGGHELEERGVRLHPVADSDQVDRIRFSVRAGGGDAGECEISFDWARGHVRAGIRTPEGDQAQVGSLLERFAIEELEAKRSAIEL